MSSQGAKAPEHGRGAGRHEAEQRPLSSVSTRQQHIAELARRHTDSPLSTLSHHLDMLWMREAFSRVRRSSAPGIDGVRVEDYAQELEGNLSGLLERAKSGSYRAPPVKRRHIPKNERETRPIGLPTTENKVLERAVVMLLEPIYEGDFYDCSYGFRPGRSPHQALEALRQALKEVKGGWVVEVDIRKYFDTIPHSQLREVHRRRVKDGVILRLIDKWLKAGVWEQGEITYTEEGTPQGGVISPMLSNIYLHEVLDHWFEQMVKPRLGGEARLVRFADDFVMIFQRREDAEKVMEVIPKRFEKYGLSIHPGKTRLVDFRHPWKSRTKPDTFDFLGFTHYWGKTRKGGHAVKKKTASKKLGQKVKELRQWCKANRHKPLAEQHQALCQKLQGHCAYYGVTGNIRSLVAYRRALLRAWQYWLHRRSRKRDGMSWARFWQITVNPYPIPPVRIVHSAAAREQECFGF